MINQSTHSNNIENRQEGGGNSFKIQELILLRIAVLALGEVQNFGWWKSQFLSTTGLNFLDRVFPRTKFIAAVRSASRVALLSHDASIGRGDVFHLFRIPAIEETIEEYLSTNGNELIPNVLPKLNSRDELLGFLTGMTKGTSPIKQAGPIRLSKSQWGDITLLASMYLQGFVNKTPVYPYFLD